MVSPPDNLQLLSLFWAALIIFARYNITVFKRPFSILCTLNKEKAPVGAGYCEISLTALLRECNNNNNNPSLADTELARR